MDVFGIAASGLQAAQAQLNAVANNIANQNTPGFTADRVDLTSGPNGSGVEVAGVQSTGSPTDPAQQLIALQQAGFLYDANAMVIGVADQMYGTLLNVLDSQTSSNGAAGADTGVTQAPLTGEPLVSEDPFHLLSGRFGYAPAFLMQFMAEKPQIVG
jgi:flagellar basal body rod protein FlgG